MRILNKITRAPHFPFPAPFIATIQIRFKKPANTAQTRLETRPLDSKLDHLAFHQRRLALALSLYNLVSDKKRGPFVSLNLLTRWAPLAGLNTLTAGEFLRKYPHVFELFAHPVRRNLCCTFTPKFIELLKLEHEVLNGMEDANLVRIRKILSMSVKGRVHVHAIRLMRRELGLPNEFVDSIIRKHSEIFRMMDLEVVELVDWEDDREGRMHFAAKVEKWREREYKEKWLSEFDTKYAFPINFPTGFKIVAGFKEKLKKWQRLSYVKPYERMQKVGVGTCGGVERYEKRAVGVIHELLSLTVEKMVEMERLAHFRKDLGIEVNLREVVLKHPGIFYVATRGKSQILFLREAFKGGCLVEPNAVYDVRRRIMELMLLGRRNTSELRGKEKVGDDEQVVINTKNGGAAKDGDFVIPILETFSHDDKR